MISSYIIHNFKAYGKKQNIKFKPITLLYGPNSKGKTSLLQSLLLLKQSKLDRPAQSALSFNGEILSLGNYRNVVFNHEVDKDITFGFEIDLNQPFDKLNKTIILLSFLKARKLRIEFGFSQNNIQENIENTILKNISIYANEEKSPICVYENLLKPPHFKSFKLIKVDYENPVFLKIWEKHKLKVIGENVDKLYGKINEFKSRYPNYQKDIKKFLSDSDAAKVDTGVSKNVLPILMLMNEVSNMVVKFKGLEDKDIFTEIKKIDPKNSGASSINSRNYLPMQSDSGINDLKESMSLASTIMEDRKLFNSEQHFKDFPEPISPFTDLFNELNSITIGLSSLVDKFIDNLYYLGPLRSYPKRIYNIENVDLSYVGYDGANSPYILYNMTKENLDVINDYLKRFNIDYKIWIDDIKTNIGTKYFALELYDEVHHRVSSYADVGFGISQITPIIIQSFISKNSMISIEQPEVHIHPKLQAELGSLFSTCIKEPYNNSFLIETHSENLILRLQKLIKKKEISNEDIAVYFIDKSANPEVGSTILPLRLDEDGDFMDRWPKGFFEESIQEILGW
jgi:AAA15 family ATPase/GTPase